MPRRRFTKQDDDEFETEAFSYLNKKSEDHRESDQSESDDEDLQGDKADDDIMGGRDEEDEDSDDEAPEDIAFHESKQSALAQVKVALQQITSERERKKVARKKLDAQFKKQKAEKLKQLSKAKLPEDILDSLDEHIPAKKPKVDKKANKHKRHFKDSSPQKPAPNDERSGDGVDEDYIAFTDSASGVKVANLKAVEKQTKTLAQAAADFRNNRLYGKHIRRESNKERLATSEKRRHRFR